MTLMNAWRWIRYPRTALADRRRTAYARPRRELKRWQVWLYAIGALVAALAIWWPAEMVNVQPAWGRSVQAPTERVLPLERPSRPPHPICIYRIPGRC
jgi:hypothetical protein